MGIRGRKASVDETEEKYGTTAREHTRSRLKSRVESGTTGYEEEDGPPADASAARLLLPPGGRARLASRQSIRTVRPR